MKTLLPLITASALAIGTLAGCAGAPTAPIGAVGALPAEQEVAMTARLDITGPSGYRLQTLTAWNLSDIDHVTLVLLKEAGNGTYAPTGATKTIARAALSQPVTLSNLKMATQYKVVAKAYADAAATNQIDNTAEAGSDAANAVVFSTPSLVISASGDTIDSASRTLTIPVKLKNKTFAGSANSGAGLTVINGTIVNTTAGESF